MQGLLDNLDVGQARHGRAETAYGCDGRLGDMISSLSRWIPSQGGIRSEPEQPVAGCSDASLSDGGWVIELNSETLPRVLVNNGYAEVSVASKDKRPTDQGAFVGQLAGPLATPACDDHPRRPSWSAARCFLRARGAASPPIGPARYRGCHRNAREHGQPGHQQRSCHTARHPGTQVFTSSIASAGGGEAHSAEVRHRIKTLIDAENRKVLSDDRIRLLQADSIDIAHRTVAKYRKL